MAPPRRSVLIARRLAEQPEAGLGDPHYSPHVLRHLCAIADERTSCGDRRGLQIAGLCCRLAGRLRTDDARARSFAQLASALRAAGRLDHADKAIGIGLAAAPPHLEGDLLRRRAWVRIYQKRLGAALADVEAALPLTGGSCHARTLEALGVVQGYRGEHRAAIRALGRCLEETDPSAGTDYCNAIHNYATALSRGTDAEAAKALELCAQLRPRLKYRHKIQRASLWWTEGLIHHRLGHADAAWRSLNHGRRSLVALGAAAEVAAIVADMARVSPQQPAVRLLCDEAAEVIGAHRGLLRPLRALAAAAREMIPDDAAALRQAAGRLAACPAP